MASLRPNVARKRRISHAAGLLFLAPAGAAVGQTCNGWYPVTYLADHSDAAMAYDSARGVTVLFEAATGTTWEWNSAFWTLRSQTGPNLRGGTEMAYDAVRGATVLFGGISGATYLGDTWLWDGAAWTQGPGGPPPRSQHAMAYNPATSTTFLFGGQLDQGVFASDLWEWNGVSWTQLPGSGPVGRRGPAMAPDAGGLIMFGGATFDFLGDTWRWNGATWLFPGVLGPSARTGHAMALEPAGVLLFGGHSAETWVWAQGAWQMRAMPGPPALSGNGLAFDTARSRTVLSGGNYRLQPSGTERPSTGTWEWNGASWSFRGSSPARRDSPALAFDSARAKLVLFGGFGPQALGSVGDETWEYDGVSWVFRIATGPSARVSHAMAFDSLRARTVLFGGYTQPTFFAGNSDTWEWNGSDWSLRTNAGPHARMAHALVFDPDRGATILFGGTYRPAGSGFTYLNDTWVWDGNSWSQLPGLAPAPRAYHAMAYDPLRHRTILFGGGGAQYLADTWELGPAGWVQIQAAGPSARGEATMAFDPASGGVVLSGGATNTGLTDEAWSWNGLAWTLLPGPGPTARSAAAAAFDSARNVMILLGGSGSSGRVLDTMWERGNTLPHITVQPAAPPASPGQPVMLHVQAFGAAPLSYQWRRNGSPLSNGGAIHGADTGSLFINPFSAGDAGAYSVQISNSCGSVTSASVVLGASCYPNCDNSTIPPVLNIQDFTCFINRFASGETYANCDNSTIPPVLNIQDFSCFLNSFAVGCT